MCDCVKDCGVVAEVVAVAVEDCDVSRVEVLVNVSEDDCVG